MKTRSFTILTLLLGAAIGLLAFACSTEAAAENGVQAPAVVIARPEKRKFSRSFETASTATAFRAAYLNPKVPATIRRFVVKEGDPVKEGQLLAQLDDSDYAVAVNASRSQLEAAEAGIQQAEAAFAKISADYERFKKLRENGSVSESEFEQVRTGYQQAQAALALTKAQRNVAATALEGNLRQVRYTAITAPFSGHVAARNGEIGEMASPASPRPMFEIVQADKLRIQVFISELEIGGISPDTTAQVVFDPFPDDPVPAKVNFINSKVDPVTKSVKVEFLVDNPKMKFKPGMTVRVRLSLPEREYLVIPRNAVFTRDNEAGVVYVKDAEDRVFPKEIFLGGTVEGFAIVTSGLTGDEEIVVGGGRRLETGQKVTVVTPTAPTK